MTCWSFLVPEWDGYDITIWTHPAPSPPPLDEGNHDRDQAKREWVPRKAKAIGTISAGDPLGKPSWSSGVRRKQSSDEPMGKAVESVMEEWQMKEVRPGEWAEDKDDQN